MKRILLLTATGLLVAPAFAGSEILPISGTDYLYYDEATGKIIPPTNTRRAGCSLWAATGIPRYFAALSPPETLLDWGDIAGPVAVGGFAFTEFTNSQASDGDLWAAAYIYVEENGWNSVDRVASGLIISNIPASTHPPNEYWGGVWRVELSTPFVLDGSDLDEDGLVDFGYCVCFGGVSAGAVVGPALITFDPNAAPGADGCADFFHGCPPCGVYQGTGCGPNRPWQVYWEMFAPACPNRGDSGKYCEADIALPPDCIVNLADLAQLLSNYGMTTGATLLDGDVDPCDECDPGDGDVDLADLAELLSQYGDDCSWP